MDNPDTKPEKEFTREEPIAIIEQPWSREAIITIENPSPQQEVKAETKEDSKEQETEPVSTEPVLEESSIQTEPVAKVSPPQNPPAPEEDIPVPTVASIANPPPPIHNPPTKDPYRYDAPYPSTKGVGKNLAYAKIIQESLSSPISEFTAISQYVFDHMISGPQNVDISEAFEGIAIVEMEHLELLGKLIIELGAIPYYKGDWRNKFWQGNFVKYNTNLRTMILCAISDEKKAISQYQRSIDMIKEPKICKLLERIILDEEVHIEIFKELLRKL